MQFNVSEKEYSKEFLETWINDCRKNKYKLPYLVKMMLDYIVYLQAQRITLESKVTTVETAKEDFERRITELESKVTTMEAK